LLAVTSRKGRIGYHGSEYHLVGGFSELSPNFGDGVKDQAAAWA
jgi:hypothetical protein